MDHIVTSRPSRKSWDVATRQAQGGQRLAAVSSPHEQRIPIKDRGDPANPAFESEFYLFAHINRITTRYNAASARALRSVGLDQPGWRVLMILSEAGPLSIGELADTSAVKQSTLTRIVQRMQRVGLVETRTRASDQRIVDVFVTRRGRQLRERSRPVVSRLYRAAVADIDDSDLSTLLELARRLESALGKKR